MNTTNTCTEEQAIALAGVSARTLHRFCESGYLTQTTSEHGEVLYSKTQLQEIFGALDADAESTNDELDTETTEPSTTSHTSAANTEAVGSHDAESIDTSAPTSSSDIEYTTSPRSASRANIRAEVEIERLKNLLAIQERMLDSKDDEIADLKNQRAWLRQRIEKLEEKHDRDQILLLSETQTIRSLIAYQESRKSTFRQLLEWIGVAPSQSYTALPQSHGQGSSHGQAMQSAGSGSGRTIEVKQAANQG